MMHNMREVGGMLLGHVRLHQEHGIPEGSTGPWSFFMQYLILNNFVFRPNGYPLYTLFVGVSILFYRVNILSNNLSFYFLLLLHHACGQSAEWAAFFLTYRMWQG